MKYSFKQGAGMRIALICNGNNQLQQFIKFNFYDCSRLHRSSNEWADRGQVYIGTGSGLPGLRLYFSSSGDLICVVGAVHRLVVLARLVR